MKNKLYYVFYWILEAYRIKGSDYNILNGIVIFSALIIINAFTILAVLSVSVLHLGMLDSLFLLDFFNLFKTESNVFNRYVVYPLIVTPIMGVFYYYYRLNREEILNSVKIFAEEKNGKRDKNAKVYVLLSFILFILSCILAATTASRS